MDPVQPQTASEANRLYWETDLSVGDIAQRLDISRRALYDSIHAVPAQGNCHRCGGTLEFSNRSARVHGFATCAACGMQAPVAAEPAPWTWSPPARAVAHAVDPATPYISWWLGAAALAGALVAAAATLMVLRDDP